MSSILRAWTFWILTPLRDECREHLERTKLPEYRAVPGCQRAIAMFRDLGDGSTEVAFLSIWDSIEHIRAHVGEAILESTIDPEDHHKLLDREPRVRHYAVTDRSAVGFMPAEWRELIPPVGR
jgi:Antibiotic biosynthesis monooxygenase